MLRLGRAHHGESTPVKASTLRGRLITVLSQRSALQASCTPEQRHDMTSPALGPAHHGESTPVKASDQRGHIEVVDVEGEIDYCAKPALIILLLSRLAISLLRKEQRHDTTCPALGKGIRLLSSVAGMLSVKRNDSRPLLASGRIERRGDVSS